MYNSTFGDRSMVDKMMRLFIIQAISGFVTRDYDTGLHFLNEVKTHFAQNQSNLNPTLRGLAKEIIQSLDMLAPGTSATQFKDMSFQESAPQQQTQEIFHNPTDEFKSILHRRKKRKKEDPVEREEKQGDNSLFGTLGDLDLSSISKPKEEQVVDVASAPSTEFYEEKTEFYEEEPSTPKLQISEDQIEDNKILEIMLKRKKQKGELTPEEEELLALMEKKKAERELDSNPIEKVRRRRRSRRSNLWDD